MAARLKLNPATRAAVATGLARGATHIEVAAAARISVDALDRWITRAQAADHNRRSGKKIAEREKPFLILFDDMREAEADVEYNALEQITQHLRLGVDLQTAADAAGVPRQMLDRLNERAVFAQNRLDDGERLDAENAAFLEMMTGYAQALARQKVTAIASINKAALTDWHASAWWLERTYPDEYASPNSRRRAGTGGNVGGRPLGSSSAPDRPSTGDEPPPRIRLAQIRTNQ